MRPTIQDFFSDVVPHDGVRATIHRPKGEHIFKQKAHFNLDSFLNTCISLSTAEQDLYFGMASYTQGWHDGSKLNKDGSIKKEFRTQENAKSMKALWLDIDVGETKDYKSQPDAIKALRDFIGEVKLPTPWIISSGSGGLHVYWIIDTIIPKDVWQDLANRLHTATKEHNLLADPSRTRDAASILRVPGSYNLKSDTPKEVKILIPGKSVPLQFYQTVLGKYEPDLPASLSAPVGLDLASLGLSEDDLAGLTALVGTVSDMVPEIEAEYPVRQAEDVVAGCPQIQQQKDAPEPIWRGMLATLRHCEGGIEMAHKLSAQHPDYTKEATDDKLFALENNDVPPYTCLTFEDWRPEVCRACPNYKCINSPISAPSSKITTVDVTEEGEVTKVSQTTLGDITKIPLIDTGEFKVDETGCYVLREFTNKKGVKDSFWAEIYDYPVYPLQRLRGVTDDGEPSISYIFRRHHKKGYDDFQINGDMIMSQGLINYLGSVGFLVATRNRKDMQGFMVDLLREIDDSIEEVEILNSLGWNEDQSAFLLGDKIYKTSGEVINVSPKGKAQEYSRQTRTQGFIEDWVNIANVYNRKGLEWGQVIVLSAFASPLMPIGALERAAMLFITGDKGTGKSTALQIAVSVYGNPNALMINKMDTPISRLEKLGVLNNVTAAFDEMTDMTPHEASAMAYQITQGRGKDRMSEGGKGLQANTTSWSCMPVMSANDSIVDALARHSYNSTAQMSRVLEVRAVDINDIYEEHERFDNEKLVREIPNNYGTAGDLYVRYITRNKDNIKQSILATEAEFVNRSGLTTAYRFWTYMCTRLLVANSIANELGLLSYDQDRLWDYLLFLVKQGLKNIDRYQWNPDNLLADYMLAHVGERLVVTQRNRPDSLNTKDISDPNYSDAGYVISTPVGTSDLSIRIERKEKRALLSRQSVREWCEKQQIPFNEFMNSLNRRGVLVEAKKRLTLGRYTAYAELGGRTDCIIVNLDDLNEVGVDNEDGNE